MSNNYVAVSQNVWAIFPGATCSGHSVPCSVKNICHPPFNTYLWPCHAGTRSPLFLPVSFASSHIQHIQHIEHMEEQNVSDIDGNVKSFHIYIYIHIIYIYIHNYTHTI